MKTYETITEAINDLKMRGFSNVFNLKNILDQDYDFQPNKMTIIETHRFENIIDPIENSVVYAIESTSTGIKGILVYA